MKALVHVKLKPGVLDPQGKAIGNALAGLGFTGVVEVRQGNAFTNANKALAHIMAYGRDALEAPPPRLYAGSHLPHSILKVVMESLTHHGLLPERVTSRTASSNTSRL